MPDGGGDATACQSGCENAPVASTGVTAPFTLATIVDRWPDPSMNAIFVPSGENEGSLPATPRSVGDPRPADTAKR